MPFGLPLILQNGNFPLHSRVKAQRHTAPRQTHPTFRDCQGIAPRRGASLKCGRNLRFPHKRPLPEMQCGGLVIGSVCAAAFFHRGIIPLLTLFFSASGSQKQLSPPAGGSVPWRPSLITRASGSFLPPHSPTHRAQVRSEFLPQGHTAPRHSHPASRERQRTAPRQGGCVLSAFYYNKSISRFIHLHFHRRA